MQKESDRFGSIKFFGVLFLSAFFVILIINFFVPLVKLAPPTNYENPVQEGCVQTKSGVYQCSPEWHAECKNNMCTKVGGKGVSECMPVGKYCHSPYICNDSDRGINFSKQGWVSILLNVNGGNTVHWGDKCAPDSNDLLYEYSCSAPDASVPTVTYQNCSQLGNYMCNSGACVPKEWENYLLKADIYNSNSTSAEPKILIYRYDGNSNNWIVLCDKSIGENCLIGKVALFIYNLTTENTQSLEEVAVIGIGPVSYTTAHRIFDNYGNYINVPDENILPQSQYGIEVYNSAGAIIASQTYEWMNGNIIKRSDMTSISHGFEFSINNNQSLATHYIAVKVKMTSGNATIPFIYGSPSSNQFQGAGLNSSARLGSFYTIPFIYIDKDQQGTSHHANFVVSFADY